MFVRAFQIPADKLPQHQLLDLQKVMKGELGTADSIAKATKIYETIGVYLGYATAQYLEFYDFSFFLILGRVTKGDGGDIVIKMAEKVRLFLQGGTRNRQNRKTAVLVVPAAYTDLGTLTTSVWQMTCVEATNLGF